MKKNYWYLVIAALVVLAIVITFVIIRSSQQPAPGSEIGNDQEIIPINGVQAQTYLASGTPTLKDDDRIFGSEKAALPIFVYEDYSSPYSAALADTLDKIQAESGNQVAVVVRPYIVSNSVSSLQLAVAVDCAGEQGKWKEMRALLFAQAKNQQLLADNLPNYVAQLELDDDDFTACLTNPEKSEKIEQSVAEAQGYGVQGAPTLFIGGEMIIGARPYEDFTDSNGDKIVGLKTVVASKVN
jgi:protein-disulfide isomerase